jgi:hypothetical protein
MQDLNYQLKNICKHNKDGSFATQAARQRNLDLMANQLRELGFHHLNATSLKPKHVVALVAHWKKASIALGTIKNRMAHLRWWAEKIGKPNIIPPTNIALNIDNRTYVTNQSKAISLEPQALESIKDPNIKISLELQAAFGLRREEALKFQPSFADRVDKIVLKSSWCKGGQQREVPILNDYQRDVLARAHKIAGRGSLIPSTLKYIQHLKRYERACQNANLSKVHGLRHAYAQSRYKQLTGREAPSCGGLTSKELSVEEKEIDLSARLTISEELGHHREAITAIYLGR